MIGFVWMFNAFLFWNDLLQLLCSLPNLFWSGFFYGEFMQKNLIFWILVVWFILLFVIRLEMTAGMFSFWFIMKNLGLEFTLFLLPL